MGHAAGNVLDRYLIESLIGAGAMGRVYRAKDTRLRRAVALKVLETPAAGAETEDALREARAAAAIVHPNVTSIYDADAEGGTSFIVMELVPGASLRARIGDATVELATRIRWLIEIAAALAAAHHAGVVHRDIKPENVIVRDDGLIKVLDFGVARFARAHTPARGVRAVSVVPSVATGLVGTPAYMAPEQLRGERIDGRADQFAWGVVAYELLSGRSPWTRTGGPLGVLEAIAEEEPAPLGGEVPPEVAAAVARALAKHADARFPSMAAVATALAPFVSGPLPSLRLGLGSDPRVAPPASRRGGEAQESPPSARIAPLAYTLGPSSAQPAVSPAPRGPSDVPASTAFREVDPEPAIDLEAHLALLPTAATCKGMFFQELGRSAVQGRLGAEARDLTALAERRYVPFRDYPAADYLRLLVAVARASSPGAPPGTALRRLGQAAFDTVLASHIGRTLLGVLGRDVERLLLRGPKAYQLLINFGQVSVERSAPRVFLLRARRLPAFLETYQVGVVEGALRHCGASGRLRIALESLGDGTLELTLD